LIQRVSLVAAAPLKGRGSKLRGSPVPGSNRTMAVSSVALKGTWSEAVWSSTRPQGTRLSVTQTDGSGWTAHLGLNAQEGGFRLSLPRR
jgi:hypothetical protein